MHIDKQERFDFVGANSIQLANVVRGMIICIIIPGYPVWIFAYLYKSFPFMVVVWLVSIPVCVAGAWPIRPHETMLPSCISITSDPPTMITGCWRGWKNKHWSMILNNFVFLLHDYWLSCFVKFIGLLASPSFYQIMLPNKDPQQQKRKTLNKVLFCVNAIFF